VSKQLLVVYHGDILDDMFGEVGDVCLETFVVELLSCARLGGGIVHLWANVETALGQVGVSRWKDCGSEPVFVLECWSANTCLMMGDAAGLVLQHLQQRGTACLSCFV